MVRRRQPSAAMRKASAFPPPTLAASMLKAASPEFWTMSCWTADWVALKFRIWALNDGTGTVTPMLAILYPHSANHILPPDPALRPQVAAPVGGANPSTTRDTV